MDIIHAVHAPVVIIAHIVMQAERVVFANQANQQQSKKILQVPGLCILLNRVILHNAEQRRRKERGAVVLQNQMDIAGSTVGDINYPLRF